MAQNNARDSSSDSSEDDESPENSDVEEDTVVSVFSWLIFECCFVRVCTINRFLKYFFYFYLRIG